VQSDEIIGYRISIPRVGSSNLSERAIRSRTGHSKTCRFCASGGDQRAQKHAFRSHNAQFIVRPYLTSAHAT
jgi:hypothetical protein